MVSYRLKFKQLGVEDLGVKVGGSFRAKPADVRLGRGFSTVLLAMRAAQRAGGASRTQRTSSKQVAAKSMPALGADAVKVFSLAHGAMVMHALLLS